MMDIEAKLIELEKETTRMVSAIAVGSKLADVYLGSCKALRKEIIDAWEAMEKCAASVQRENKEIYDMIADMVKDKKGLHDRIAELETTIECLREMLKRRDERIEELERQDFEKTFDRLNKEATHWRKKCVELEKQIDELADLKMLFLTAESGEDLHICSDIADSFPGGDRHTGAGFSFRVSGANKMYDVYVETEEV
jgi:chromosome segregation ATPase